jgi:nucleoid DNA-binding protein
MAKKNARKNGRKKASNGRRTATAKVPAVTTPQIVAAKGGLTQAQLLASTLESMEQENWISKKAGRDFVDSLQAVILDALSNGEPVNLFGIVKLVPRYHTAGKREVYKEFGNPDSGRVTKSYKPKVSLKATVLKTTKDALPAATKMAKAVGR